MSEPLEPTKSEPVRDELDFALPPPAKVTRPRVLAALVLGVIVLGTAFLVAYLPRRRAQSELAVSTKEAETALRHVQVVAPKVSASERAVSLPGTVQPLEQTVVYPRSSGYVRRWAVDIGDEVKEGDLLAEIDTPEIDQELAQARAELAQAQANLAQANASRELSKSNLTRYEALTPLGLATQQDLEQRQSQSLVDQAGVRVAQAAIDAQAANVRRLTGAKSFSRVTAPFGGTINARLIDRGALVSPTTPLFSLSSMDPVRVFVQVPQDIAPSVRPDVTAHLTVREYGSRVFEGQVARSAEALDPASRTMNTELRFPNPKKELLSGMYVQVSLTLPTPHRVLEVPATSLIVDAQGVRVATVGVGDKLHLVPVVVERDTGAAVEIVGGIEPTDRVVKLGGADLVDGETVIVAP